MSVSRKYIDEIENAKPMKQHTTSKVTITSRATTQSSSRTASRSYVLQNNERIASLQSSQSNPNLLQYDFFEDTDENPYPETKYFTAVVQAGEDWMPESWFFSMTVHYPADLTAGQCKPVVILNHPVQVFNASPGTEYWKQCVHLASQGFICALSREGNGQFGMVSDDNTAELSSVRSLAIWRNIYWIYNNDPTSDLYQAVCNKFCGMGYSLGGGASINMAVNKLPSENMRCIVALHPAPTTPTKAASITIPLMAGNGRNDTLTPLSETFELFANTDLPFVYPIIKDGTHILGECGNLCPIVIRCCNGPTNTFEHYPWVHAFLRLHLFDEDHLAPLIWNGPGVTLGGSGISEFSNIDTVYRFPRFTVGALTFDPIQFLGDIPAEAEILQIVNNGVASTFRVVLAGATGDIGCEDVTISTEDVLVSPGTPVPLSATISVASVMSYDGSGDCTLQFRAFDVERKVLSSTISIQTKKVRLRIYWDAMTLD